MCCVHLLDWRGLVVFRQARSPQASCCDLRLRRRGDSGRSWQYAAIAGHQCIPEAEAGWTLRLKLIFLERPTSPGMKSDLELQSLGFAAKCNLLGASAPCADLLLLSLLLLSFLLLLLWFLSLLLLLLLLL